MSKKIRCIVAGGRDFTDILTATQELDALLLDKYAIEDIEIVSGCANGADKIGELYAKNRGIAVKKFPADWDTHGKKAGYLRNTEMAEYANRCVVFWDGKSKGSKHMIDIAKAKKIITRVIRY